MCMYLCVWYVHECVIYMYAYTDIYLYITYVCIYIRIYVCLYMYV